MVGPCRIPAPSAPHPKSGPTPVRRRSAGRAAAPGVIPSTVPAQAAHFIDLVDPVADLAVVSGARRELRDAPLLAAIRGERPARPPVWFMRQAGRSLPEYRALRKGTEMLAACFTPDLACEITLQPVRRYGVDAAILFSDIVLPLKAAGLDIDIRPGVGPVLDKPLRDDGDVARLRELEADEVAYIGQAVRMLTAELGDVPLIGFAGGPFTLACYLIDGGPSKTFD